MSVSSSSSSVSVGVVGAVVAVAIFVVDDEQHHAKEEADGAHGDVGDAQEGVLSSHPGDGAQDHPLPTVKAADRIIWVSLG